VHDGNFVGVLHGHLAGHGALVHDDHAIGQEEHFLQVARGKDHGAAGVRQASHLGVDLGALCGPDTTSEALTDADILKIARLSRLDLPESKVGAVRTQLSSILGHIAKLQALPTEGVEPMTHPMKIVNRLGADEPKACMPVEELLKNAPAVEDRYLAVPKVLGDGGGA
jgi:aspartyl-tRNA(Asn)/glutamyl-tRNA(Gln) amidotransferase subunit C